MVWALAGAFGIVLAPSRLLGISDSQPTALAQLVLAGVALVAVRRWLGRDEERAPAITPATAILLLACGLPWVTLGALGSLGDTALALGIGIVSGLVAAVVLRAYVLTPAPALSASDRFVRFLVLVVALAIFAGALGWRGLNAMTVIAVPGAAVALVAGGSAGAGQRRSGAGAAGIIALAVAFPLAWLDADELVIVLGANENAGAILAATSSCLLLAIAGLVRLAAPALDRARPGLGWASVAASVLALAGVCAGFGHPGLYGERLFVVMRAQPDVSQARAIADRNHRLTFVYQTLVQQTRTTQQPVTGLLDTIGVRYRQYYLTNALEVEAEPLLRPVLASLPGVDRVLDSPRLRPISLSIPDRSDEPRRQPGPTPVWNVRYVNAPQVWTEFGAKGQGIVIGQSDSGVDGKHPALAASYRGAGRGDDYNWLDPWSGLSQPRDLGGHGTHTLGSIVGAGGIGIAPEATWFGCVNLERNLANPALYLDCMQFMLAPYPKGADPLSAGDPTRAAHVMNNSWGCPPIEGCDPAVLGPAVRALTDAGIFVVVSAGNDGPGCGTVTSPPAIYADAFSVGAIDRNGKLAEFSSRGPVTVDGSGRAKPDIVAPGVEVMSALPGGGYGANSGTSMAGPQVVGVVALMWSAQPALIGDIENTRSILLNTARPVAEPEYACSPAAKPSLSTGYGAVDAYAAVREAVRFRK